MNREELIGMRFGKLVAVKLCYIPNTNRIAMECLCDCGKTKLIKPSELKRNAHTSCGCGINKKRVKVSDHPLYQIWRGMKGRCYYKHNHSYKWYGGDGVIVCDEWKKSYISFRDWCLKNGWKRGMQIDKDIIPKKLGIPAKIYSPEMCSIVTQNENKRNSKHVKLNTGKVLEIRKSLFMSDKELSNIYGVKQSVINKVRNNKMWVS